MEAKYIATQPDGAWFVLERSERTYFGGGVIGVPRAKILARCDSMEEAQRELDRLNVEPKEADDGSGHTGT